MIVPIVFFAAITPPLLLLWFFHSRDLNREPRAVVWRAFVFGMLAIVPDVLIALPLDKLLIVRLSEPFSKTLLKVLLTAAAPEELCKLFVIWFYCARHREFDEPMDGIVYGAIVGLGFATLENVLYVAQSGIGIALLRAFTAVPGHAFMGAIMGYFVGQAKFRGSGKGALLAKAYLVPVALHTLVDLGPIFALVIKNTPDEHRYKPIVVALLALMLAVLVFEWRWALRLLRRLRAEQETLAAANALQAQRARDLASIA